MMHGKKNNNNGSTFVIVLIIVTFITILGSVAMLSALTNLEMKKVEAKNKKTFYTAEEAVDKIYAGLGKMSLEKYNDAYNDEMAEVADNNGINNAKCNRDVRVMFAQKIYDEFFHTTSLTWDAEHDMKYIENNGTLVTDNTPYICKNITSDNDNLEVIKTYLTNNYLSDTTGITINSIGYFDVYISKYADDGYNFDLYLKNCSISYRTDDDYFADVTVDYKLSAPTRDAAFLTNQNDNTLLKSFTDFSLIGVQGILIDKKNLTVNSTGIYAGNAGQAGNDTPSSLKIAGGNLTLKEDNNNNKGSIAVSDGLIACTGSSKIYSSQASRIWCENFDIDKQSNNCELILDGSEFVKDDLDVNGESNTVKLNGNYVGFMNQGESYYSSALLMNGKNSVLDLTGIKSLIVGGKSYVKMGSDEVDKYATGESVSLKTAQRMYVVPDSCLNADKTLDTSKIGNDILNLLTENRVKSYVYNKAENKSIYYFDFKDDECRNEFAKKVSEGLTINGTGITAVINNDISENGQQILVNETDIGNNNVQLYSNSNIVSTRTDANSLSVLNSIFQHNTIGNNDFSVLQSEVSKRYELLTKYLYDDAFYQDGTQPNGKNDIIQSSGKKIKTSSLDTSEISQEGYGIFSRYVNTAEIEKIPASTPVKLTTNEINKKSYEVIIANGNYTVDHDMYGLIVAKGNVDVQSNFHGTILASGAVYITGNDVNVYNPFSGNGLDEICNNLNDQKDVNGQIPRDEFKKYFTAYNGETGIQNNNSEYLDLNNFTYKNLIAIQNWSKQGITAD